jgi:hypothetical protein
MAKGTVWNGAWPDRTLAGEWEEQDHVRGNDSTGHQIREKQDHLVGFENHPDDNSRLDHPDVGSAPDQKITRTFGSPETKLFE